MADVREVDDTWPQRYDTTALNPPRFFDGLVQHSQAEARLQESKMRLVYYITTSIALAMGVIINALHRRSNFYSACVYLAQSNACLMILTNVSLLAVSVMMLGLQKLFYGPLRPIEIEQLYEKAWFAVTETCLAMTIFREEVGGWFFVMFVGLLAGKIWGWIGEGRVEVLEQQPPANPRLFHARLSTSLFVATTFDVFMLSYTVGTVLQHARPNMMVMFAFEFAVLCVTSACTCGRYVIFLREAQIIRSQVQQRQIHIRRHRVSGANNDAASSGQHGGDGDTLSLPGPETEMHQLDADVPGWDDKGKWIFYLDLATDFFKLILYLTFFCVLCMFYGMPIHIIRDVALTIRSFHKRILDFIRYRQATRDMNTRYPDASTEEVNREDCCIICREEMRAWPHSSAQAIPPLNHERGTPSDERLRPKKLPCGHVLHFTCLRSWLERQQNCPTCRAPVLTSTRPPPSISPIPVQQAQRNTAPPNIPPNQPARGRNGPRNGGLPNMLQFGPLRILFGARYEHPFPHQRFGEPGGVPLQQHHVEPTGRFGENLAPSSPVPTLTALDHGSLPITSQIQEIEHRLLRELGDLQLHANQLQIVRALQNELSRLQHSHNQISLAELARGSLGPPSTMTHTNINQGVPHIHQTPRLQPAFSASSEAPNIGSGHEQLPNGMTLPEGWTVLPLQAVSLNPANHTTSTGPTPLDPSSVGASLYAPPQIHAVEPSSVSSTPPIIPPTQDDEGCEKETQQQNKCFKSGVQAREGLSDTGTTQNVDGRKARRVTVEDDDVAESN